MFINKSPDYIFKNKEAKKIYCWKEEKDIIFSLTNLYESEGKYKAIDKKNISDIKTTISKLGLSPTTIDKIKLTEEVKQKSPFYKDVPQLTRLRNNMNRHILRRSGTNLLNEGNQIKPKNNHELNLNDLAFISGVLEKPAITEDKEVQKETKLYNDGISINKEKFNNYLNNIEIKENIPVDKKLSEGKNDKIELGTVEVKSTLGNLYNITIENLPGKDQFHAKLYSLILKYIEGELPNYLEQHPEIKDLQNYTKSQLSGEAQEAEGAEGAEGVDLGLAPEGAEAEAGAGVPPAGAEVTQPATEAGVPAVEGGEVPTV